MGNVQNTIAKNIRICAKSKRWRNADIRERRMAVGREQWTRRNLEENIREKEELQEVNSTVHK
jgi:hypothetical protein